MIRRNAMPEGKYDVRLKTVSDWLFFIEIALAGRVIKLKQIFARYRNHCNGLSQQSLNLPDELLHALDLLVEKHSDNKALPSLVLQTKARYVVRDASSRKIAYRFSKKALFFSPKIQHRSLFFVVWLNLKVSSGHFLIKFLANKGTYLLKE